MLHLKCEDKIDVNSWLPFILQPNCQIATLNIAVFLHFTCIDFLDINHGSIERIPNRCILSHYTSLLISESISFISIKKDCFDFTGKFWSSQYLLTSAKASKDLMGTWWKFKIVYVWQENL